MAKILVVDDSRELIECLSLLLRMKNYEVYTAASTEELKHQFSAVSPDLVLLDVRLGCDDGREICKALRNEMHGKYIPIILVSANPELLKDFVEYEADDIMEKPFNINTIVSKIDLHLHKKLQLI